MRKMVLLCVLSLTIFCFASCVNDHSHKFGEWSVTKNATCIENGERERSCECGEKQTSIVYAHGKHTKETIPGTEATCTVAGLTDGTKCSVCGKILKAQESVLAPHDIVIDTAVDPTCTEAGLTAGEHCSVCNTVIVEQEIVPAAHVESDWIIDLAPTQNKEGFRHQICIKCEITLKEEKIPPLGSVGLSYSVNSDGKTCTVTGIGTCSDRNLYIGQYIDGYEVTAIGDSAFSMNYSLVSLVIGDSVTSIGNNAFSNCDFIGSVIIGDGVTIIGERAFSSCDELHSVVIGDNVTIIGNKAFILCYDMSSIIIPDSVTTIGERAFDSCNSLASVELGDSVTTIGDFAFASCKEIGSVVIPGSVTTIGSGAFYNCDELLNIEVDIENKSYKSIDGNLYTKDGKTFLQYAIRKWDSEFTIPDGVTIIGERAFSFCDKLNSVVIPNSVTVIGNSAFSSCDNLNSIIIPNSVITIGNSAFSSCDNLNSITIPNSVITIGDSAFSSCCSLVSVIIPDSVTNIGESAFFLCDILKNIEVNTENKNYKSIDGNLYTKDGKTLVQFAPGKSSDGFAIPDSVTTIGDYAFAFCNEFKSVVIPDSVTTIGSYAFEYCRNLGSVVIGNSVTTIGDSAFYNCTYLNYVVIGDSVSTIGDYAFAYCDRLWTVYYTASEEDWAKLSIGNNNNYLTNSAIIYNYDAEQ